MKKNKTAAHILDFQSFPSGIFSFSDIWNLILFSTLNPLVNITNLTFIESFKGKCFIAFVFWKLSHIIDISFQKIQYSRVNMTKLSIVGSISKVLQWRQHALVKFKYKLYHVAVKRK